MGSSTLGITVAASVAHVTLDRPDVRNAFDADLIAALEAAFRDLAGDHSVRAIVLGGAGSTFCGGADIAYMRASLERTAEENRGDARAMARMFATIDACPKPVIGRVRGAALGGGAGLVAVCDIAIAEKGTRFGFTETKLGILPAVISPFLLAKIGASQLRALALTGERFDADRAHRIGLIHEVVAGEDALDAAITRTLAEVRTASPTGIAAAKALFARLRESPREGLAELTADAIATQRVSPEGQDGLMAFLEKRPPAWAR